MIILKENYDEWLRYVDPSLNALIAYLSRQNEGIPVNVQHTHIDEHGGQIFFLSNGFSYTKDENRKWKMIKP